MKNQRNPAGAGRRCGYFGKSDKRPACVKAAILAGGPSSRMDSPKAALGISGRSILRWELDALSGVVDDVMVVCKGKAVPAGGRARIVNDVPEFEGHVGPLAGIYTALAESGGAGVLVLGCDMPFVRPELLRGLVSLADGARTVVPVVDGLFEPLLAVYPHGALPVARGLLENAEMKLSRLIDRLDVIEVHEDELRRLDPELVSFTNVNTPAELERARELAKALYPAGGTARFADTKTIAGFASAREV